MASAAPRTFLSMNKKVVVVGAGLAGLTAAYCLHAQGTDVVTFLLDVPGTMEAACESAERVVPPQSLYI